MGCLLTVGRGVPKMDKVGQNVRASDLGREADVAGYIEGNADRLLDVGRIEGVKVPPLEVVAIWSGSDTRPVEIFVIGGRVELSNWRRRLVAESIVEGEDMCIWFALVGGAGDNSGTGGTSDA